MPPFPTDLPRYHPPRLVLAHDAAAGSVPARDGNETAPRSSPSEPQRAPGGPEPFRCDVTRERDTATVRTVGELDLATVPLLADQIAQLRQAGCRHVIFDLGNLVFIDSTGLRFLLTCHAGARQDGYTIALLPGPPAVHRVFELTGTTDILPFIDL